jgi:hypothetical protein
MPLLPPYNPLPKSYPRDNEEIWRDIRALWRSLRGLKTPLSNEIPLPVGDSGDPGYGEEAARWDHIHSGTDAENDVSIAHMFEILKDAGDAPLGEYTTTYLPMTHWPHVWAGGVPQTNGVDFTVEGQDIIIDPAMNLHTDESLICRYDYKTGFAQDIASLPVSVVGQLYDMGYGYTYDLILPDTIQAGDLMVAISAHWHNWGVNTAGGWATWYSSLSNSGKVAAKFITTEVPGDHVFPSAGGQGWRGWCGMAIVRGVNPSSPLHAIDTNDGLGGATPAAITISGGNKRTLWANLGYAGTPDPTLTRGVDLVHAWDGTNGGRITTELLAPGSYNATGAAGFTAAVALNSDD